MSAIFIIRIQITCSCSLDSIRLNSFKWPAETCKAVMYVSTQMESMGHKSNLNWCKNSTKYLHIPSDSLYSNRRQWLQKIDHNLCCTNPCKYYALTANTRNSCYSRKLMKCIFSLTSPWFTINFRMDCSNCNYNRKISRLEGNRCDLAVT